MQGPDDGEPDGCMQLTAWALAMNLLVPSPRPAFLATPSPPHPDDDVVETIGAPPAPSATKGDATSGDVVEMTGPSPSTSRAPERLESPDRYTLSGWALEELHLTLGNAALRPSYLSVPLDRAIERTRAFVRFRYAHARWFEVDASSAISYSYFVEGLAGSLPDDLDHFATRGSFEPSARELYFAFFTSALDIRVGQQRVAWGRADAQSPNDVLNARDLRDPLQPEADLAQIPTPLARVDWSFGSGALEGVWAPFFVPDEFDLYGSNWAIIQPDAPAGVRGFFKAMSSLVDRSLVDPFNRLIEQSRIPSPAAGNMAGGAKLSIAAGDVDFDAYYHYGFDRTPLLRMDPAFQDTLNHTDFSRVKAGDFGAAFSSIQAGFPPITSEYVHRHHVGLDAGTVVGPIGLRLDVGYDTQRVFFHRDMTGTLSPAVQAVASVEYQTGDVRKVLLVEAAVLRVMDPVDSLLFAAQTTFTGTCLLRVPLLGSFDGELRGVFSVSPQSVILRPQLDWRATDHLAIEVGGLWLTGEPWSIGSYFRRNAEVYANAKYSF